MARTSKAVAVRCLALGWAALAEARWSDARDLFAQALAAAESPEAFEGASRAAWWLDDAEAVFTARERAYRLYRQGRDRAAAARMATWLASDEHEYLLVVGRKRDTVR